MPQMYPLNWIILFMYFIIIFMFLNILNYYNFKMKNKTYNFKLLNKYSSMNWKW